MAETGEELDQAEEVGMGEKKHGSLFKETSEYRTRRSAKTVSYRKGGKDVCEGMAQLMRKKASYPHGDVRNEGSLFKAREAMCMP
jgi:hypothetical protein